MHEPAFVGNDRERIACQLEQFAWTQQVIGIARPAIGFVADPEGLVEEHPAGREGVAQVGE